MCKWVFDDTDNEQDLCVTRLNDKLNDTCLTIKKTCV